MSPDPSADLEQRARRLKARALRLAQNLEEHQAHVVAQRTELARCLRELDEVHATLSAR